jgi:hypothetical protein
MKRLLAAIFFHVQDYCDYKAHSGFESDDGIYCIQMIRPSSHLFLMLLWTMMTSSRYYAQQLFKDGLTKLMI